ncbi:Peptidase S24/S26A/S26B, conserved region [Natrinema pellirubrum DSM 15624]|uniref:Peptidase S24/S26A/S26B, conserved region n=1 Tax=Natrinema pellirubrum (strain DSM 15624 / CIP 106293 / JCM 10476 / NCIMB 786 / 157) TaxID=797303 RepID=L0JF83_NATP1|nr:S26 family signal peptidase [Natrinema pellirubrum]AGB29954.1 signal peptidase I [Natrinema pellirubrum DSM 15624]ELY70498.1 Peptidase S24/S26A/S26B, conserved region [Natrinema pellirubrum DSM 15624]
MDGPDAGESDRGRSGPPDDPPTADVSDGAADRDRADDRLASRPRPGDGVTIDDGIVRWFLEADDRAAVVGRDVAASLAIVAVVGLLLFAVAGTWPPLVAVESGSMEPHLERGDLVLVVDEGRFAGDGAVDGTGIVTRERGLETGHETLGDAGDVVVFRPDGDPHQTPTIHRVQFRVEKGERWVETKADPAFVNGATCEEIASCPARYDGFITKGDANPAYDQIPRSGADTTVVKPEWVRSKAMVRLPWLGEIRLAVDSARSLLGVGPAGVAVVAGLVAIALFAAAADGRDP